MEDQGEELKNRPRWDLIAVPATACVFVYLLTFVLPATPILNESDHHMFLYEGMRLANGDVMYRDFFQFTFPGSQCWYWAMFTVFGLKYWILPATIVLIAMATAWAGLLVSRDVLDGPARLIPPVIYTFFGFRWDGLDGTHRMFSPIFILLAVAVLLRRRDRSGMLIAGALCGIASFFTQQRGVYAAAAITIFLIIETLVCSRPTRHLLSNIAAVWGAFSITLAGLCGYFVYSAGWNLFIDSTLLYPMRYYGAAPYNNTATLLADISGIMGATGASGLTGAIESVLYLFAVPAGYAAFWIYFLLRRSSDDRARWRGIVLLATVGTAMTFTITAPNTSRLFQIAMPGLIVLTWMVVNTAPRSLSGLVRAGGMTLMGLSLAIGMMQAFKTQTGDLAYMDTPSGRLAYKSAPIIDQRYGFLIERTQPGDLVFEAYQPYIYFPLHLRNPSRYGQIWPSEYTRPEHVSETVAALITAPPKYILWNNDYNKLPREHGDHIGPLSDHLQQTYFPIGEVIAIPEGNIQVWERRN